ncbi:MAG: hypothetical protein Q8L48_01990 [Archangium sp.]|nr:hypothetical protein [Archangium sp.]
MQHFVVLSLLMLPGVVSAEERYDHRGSLGLTVAAGSEFVTAISTMATGERGWRIPLELGATFSLTNHIELRAAGRIAPGISPITALAGSAYAGMRNSFGYDQLKTFFDLELAVHVAPFFAIGARGAFGVQYDFLPIMGVYAQLGGQLGGATSLRLSFELMAGVQFRTYLFE